MPAARPTCGWFCSKDFDERGFVFYTNVGSVKGLELADTPTSGAGILLEIAERQIRIRGTVEPVSAAEADAYFATRSRMAQIGAWASKQSTALEGRLAFEKEVARYTAKYAIGTVPRPEHWSGYRVTALEIEFWQERPFRLHDRISFARSRLGGFVAQDPAFSVSAEGEIRDQDDHQQPQGQNTSSHRGEPRYRPRHGEAVSPPPVGA